MKLSMVQDLPRLVTRAQLGDETAFDAIYEQFAEPLYSYVYVRCGDVKLAENLIADLWVKVVEYLPPFRFRHMASEMVFRAWLYQIARNLICDFYGNSARETIPVVETMPYMLLDDHVIQDEVLQHLTESMKCLTPDECEVIFFRFIEERSIAEAITLTGQPEGAVKLHQYHALRALAGLLGGQRQQGQ